MTQNNTKTALVTGANSGIGFEASAQLAEAGFRRVILACRTMEKAEAAKVQLRERCGTDVFEGLAVDVSERKSVAAATESLLKAGAAIDFLLLNAGVLSHGEVVCNTDGVEMTFAASLVGHHALTMSLLARRGLSAQARIVIAGSETATGNAPGANLIDVAAIARDHFNDDLEAALESVARAEQPQKFIPANAYATAKLYGAWWAAAFARKLPPGITVNAVSPGSVLTTNILRHQPWVMRTILSPILSTVGGLLGMAGPVAPAARRYVEAAGFDDATTGLFFASRPGKLTGPMEVQQAPHFLDTASQTACWNVVVRLAGSVDYPAS